jgi:uncharacterized protein (DUF433 family)
MSLARTRFGIGHEENGHLDRITTDSEVFGGRPCIRGLRVRVKDVLDMLARGAARAEILEDFPYREDDDIAAALEYAAQHVDHPVIRPA